MRSSLEVPSDLNHPVILQQRGSCSLLDTVLKVWPCRDVWRADDPLVKAETSAVLSTGLSEKKPQASEQGSCGPSVACTVKVVPVWQLYRLLSLG